MNLVEILRDKSFWYTPHIADGRPMRHKVARKAADEIERLRAALQKIAMWGCINPEDHAATSEVAYKALREDEDA